VSKRIEVEIFTPTEFLDHIASSPRAARELIERLPSLKNPRTVKFLPRRTSWPVSQTIQICTETPETQPAPAWKKKYHAQVGG
jgi:hypothetical protein